MADATCISIDRRLNVGMFSSNLDNTIADCVTNNDGVCLDNLSALDIVTRMRAAIQNGDINVFRTLLGIISMKKSYKNYFRKESASILELAIVIDRYEVIELLIKAGVSCHNINSDGDSATLLAIKYGRIDILKTLVRLRQCLRCTNNKGENPLELVVRNMTSLEEFKILIAAGMKHNVKVFDWNSFKFCKRGPDSLLHILFHRLYIYDDAQYNVCCNMIQYLVSVSKVDSINFDDRFFPFTIYDLILNKPHIASIPGLVFKMATEEFPVTDRHACQLACQLEPELSLLTLECLKKQGYNVRDTGNTFVEPLFVACSVVNLLATTWLLENGADPNCLTTGLLFDPIYRRTRTSVQYSPLHAVATSITKIPHEQEHGVKIMQRLRKHGAKLSARSVDGHSALSLSMETWCIQQRGDINPFIHYLLQSGLDVESHLFVRGRLILDDVGFESEAAKVSVMMMLELNTCLARCTETTPACAWDRLRHLAKSIPESYIKQRVMQPRDLTVLTRRVILQQLKGRHIENIDEHFDMLPVKVRDWIGLKYLLNPQWYQKNCEK